jgi:hypothetical protein
MNKPSKTLPATTKTEKLAETGFQSRGIPFRKTCSESYQFSRPSGISGMFYCSTFKVMIHPKVLRKGGKNEVHYFKDLASCFDFIETLI